ncbi:SafA/ExsA family spore coat assembly protein [Alteribacillus sp. HJP-4]|uniref:SafA/ExsA family spore coat assembly protein n=1 Tax=Alteribacillus sp. HJP-4 TaxID=2775394 RepID=UPI0035CCCD56
MQIHIVQKGDTLWKLSKQYQVDFEEVKKANGHLANPDQIMPGMKIKIPAKGVPVKKEYVKEQVKEKVKEQPVSKPKEQPKEVKPQMKPKVQPKMKPKVQPKMKPKVQAKVEAKIKSDQKAPQEKPSMPIKPKAAEKNQHMLHQSSS